VIPIIQIQQCSMYQAEVEEEVHHMYDPNVSIV
jgi:hypothetical protein